MKIIKEFIAFDVETAASNRDSICSIGYVKVYHDRIIKSVQYLVRPFNLDFSCINTSIHGITKNDIINAYEINKIWTEIKSDFSNYPLVAHNISFDLSC